MKANWKKVLDIKAGGKVMWILKINEYGNLFIIPIGYSENSYVKAAVSQYCRWNSKLNNVTFDFPNEVPNYAAKAIKRWCKKYYQSEIAKLLKQ